jgi:hypothetical protein
MKEVIFVSKPDEGKNWKLETVSSRKQGQCDGIVCQSLRRQYFMPMPPFLAFRYKAIEADFDITLNKEKSRCFYCANDILDRLENSRNGIIVKNPKVLSTLRQELTKLDYLNILIRRRF